MTVELAEPAPDASELRRYPTTRWARRRCPRAGRNVDRSAHRDLPELCRVLRRSRRQPALAGCRRVGWTHRPRRPGWHDRRTACRGDGHDRLQVGGDGMVGSVEARDSEPSGG